MNKDNYLEIKKRITIVLLTMLVFIIGAVSIIFINHSLSAPLENDVEVSPNSQLTYYLNVSYDGVDKDGNNSSNSSVLEIKSGYLYVEDKLPEGLIFDGFVTTEDGSIGAVERGSGAACVGKVIDDTNENVVDTGVWNEDKTEYTYHGLHYNASNRTVNFTIKNLRAGCEVVVGIKTTTPSVDDPDTEERETRRDFYNFASAREDRLTLSSNTVHAYMGSEFATLYNVSYEYTGDVPTNAPSVPSTTSFMAGIKVGVAANVNLEGYTFSGWSTDNTSVSNGTFKMPANDVLFKGSFSKDNSNKVSYRIEGVTPDNYVVPTEKSYYAGATINVDSLEVGSVFNGYRFLGWETTDVLVSLDNDFIMPEKDVLFVGKFEEVTYSVSYQFYDTVLPPNAEDYLPETKTYKPGSVVIVEDVEGDADGYKFLGWYKESEFVMPEEDVVIYGEWKVQTGTFEPVITKEVIGDKEYYQVGEVVEFKIIVTNTADFTINNVIVSEDNDNSKFIAGNNYTVLSDHVANIESIPAGGQVEVYAEYKVLETDKGLIKNSVMIKGALADNDFELLDKEYMASAEVKVKSKLKICKVVSGAVVANTFQFQVSGITDKYETWITMDNDQCGTIFIEPGTYKIREIVPQEYEIISITGAISSNNESLVVELGKDYEVTYTNEFKKKGFLHSFGRVVNKVIQGGM